MPESSVAHFQKVLFLSQGIAKSPICTLGTKVPSRFGSLHGQQKPATMLAEFVFSKLRSRTSVIISAGVPKILNFIRASNAANSESEMLRTLSSHCKYASEPEHLN